MNTKRIEIKQRYIGAVLWEGSAVAFRAAVEAAVGAKANLRGADLRGANLRGADLRDADLLCLPVGDPRAYRPVAIWRDTWRIVSGCRDFSLAEAREHWGETYKGDPAIGAQYVAACDWLESQPLPAWATTETEETE